MEPGGPLAEDKMIEVDGDDQRFGHGMAVRLAREDSMLRRKHDAKELLEIGEVVRSGCTAANLYLVIVPFPQSRFIEVQCLLCAVGRDILGKADF
jgi:hypothetical protein